MRSYFSRLAKQSGLRLSEQKTKPRVSAAEEKLKPPHAEETVFVSQPENRPHPVEKRREEVARTLLTESKKSNSETSADSPPENAGTVEIPPLAAGKTAKEKSFAPEKQTVQTGERRETVEKQPENARFVIEEMSFVKEWQDAVSEVAEPDEPFFLETSSVFANDSETPPDITEKEVPKQSGRKTYFEKTEKILEEGGFSRRETERTILEEIQQWVADAPVLPEAEDKKPPPERTVKIISAPEKQETISGEVENGKNAQTAVLEEQNLNLSIGNITVHIEGEEKDSRPETLPPNNSKAADERKSERRFSRLSRYYL